MTDINEKETIDYFVHGIKKAQQAAKELAILNQRSAWSQISIGLGQILENAKKLYTSKPQTRSNNLIMAAQIQSETEIEDASSEKVIH